jgi:DNA-directed RNA polymerase specialized sigma24 family protein
VPASSATANHTKASNLQDLHDHEEATTMPQHALMTQVSSPVRGASAWKRCEVQQHGDSDAGAAAPEQMDLFALMRRCGVESERFYTDQPHDTRFAYELFRRALVERDEMAWQYIYGHYSPLVERWVRRCGAFARTGESCEFFVVLAFTKFWRAINADRFNSFTNLAALLHYLQMCANCAVIDNVRAQARNGALVEEALSAMHMLYRSPDEEAMDRVTREEFWKYISKQLHDEAERVVVFSSFIMGLKPGDICHQRPDLFPCVNDVYNTKRSVIGRLSRDQQLRRMLGARERRERAAM